MRVTHRALWFQAVVAFLTAASAVGLFTTLGLDNLSWSRALPRAVLFFAASYAFQQLYSQLVWWIARWLGAERALDGPAS